jgi:hypothetical protein
MRNVQYLTFIGVIYHVENSVKCQIPWIGNDYGAFRQENKSLSVLFNAFLAEKKEETQEMAGALSPAR